MLERVSLSMLAAVAMARVTTGMIKCFMVTTPVKVDGRRPSFSENSKTNIIASQNWGTAAKNMANMVLTKSRPEYCRTADMTPMGTPIITARQIESTPMRNVTPKREKISSNTG